jgi:hypothetical protein
MRQHIDADGLVGGRKHALDRPVPFVIAAVIVESAPQDGKRLPPNMAKPTDPAMKQRSRSVARTRRGARPPSARGSRSPPESAPRSNRPANRSAGTRPASGRSARRDGVYRRLPWPSLLRSLRTNVFGNIPPSRGQKPAMSRCLHPRSPCSGRVLIKREMLRLLEESDDANLPRRDCDTCHAGDQTRP